MKADSPRLPLLALIFIGLVIIASIQQRRQSAMLILPLHAQPSDFLDDFRQALPEPILDAHAYTVEIAGEKIPALEKRAWKAHAPASLTKLMTVLIAAEELGAHEMITLTPDTKNTEQKISAIPTGEELQRDDMLQLALIESANDAALALAEAVGQKHGGKTFSQRLSLFVQLMEEKGQLLGLTHSSFRNPTGLDQEGHRISAHDLAKILGYLWDTHRALVEFTKKIETTITSATGHTYHIKNTNELLSEFPALYGGKTGLTDEALGTLALIYPIPPNRIARIIILGSQNRFEDGRKIIRWLEEKFK